MTDKRKNEDKEAVGMERSGMNQNLPPAGPDGFIPWSGGENPVGSAKVDFVSDRGHTTGFGIPADSIVPWSAVEKFRLIPTSSPIEDAERAGDGAFEARAIALVKKHGDPNGTDYEQGQNDMGHRMVTLAQDADRQIAALSTDPVSDVEVRAELASMAWRFRGNDRLGGPFYESAKPSDSPAMADAFGFADACLALIARTQPKGAGQSSGDQVGRFITFNPSGEWGCAVISSDEPASGTYWTLIGAGPDHDQNALARQIVERLNRPTDNADGLSADRERRFRHKTRGTEYTLIGNGKAQCSPSGLLDDENIVLYRGDDGSLWARRYAEFWDGRFEEIDTALAALKDRA